MNIIHEWSLAWGVSIHAVNDLLQRLGTGYAPPQVGETDGMSETAIQTIVRLDAARRGVLLWRNNVGEMADEHGGRVRYGLCNDSKKLNTAIKSADLIGIKPVLITPVMVGGTIGQFVSLEVKRGGWVYTGDDHEIAQCKWRDIILGKGGHAAFVTGPGGV